MIIVTMATLFTKHFLLIEVFFISSSCALTGAKHYLPFVRTSIIVSGVLDCLDGAAIAPLIT